MAYKKPTLQDKMRITVWIDGDDTWLYRTKKWINRGPHECELIMNREGKKALAFIDGYFDEHGNWVYADRRRRRTAEELANKEGY